VQSTDYLYRNELSYPTLGAEHRNINTNYPKKSFRDEYLEMLNKFEISYKDEIAMRIIFTHCAFAKLQRSKEPGMIISWRIPCDRFNKK
jgi:hypothetical protein